MQSKRKLVSIALLVLIVLVVLFYAAPVVAAAIQRWFGYVPGAGLVHAGQIRSLAGPVSLSRGGISVTVDQVILNEERTVLVYSVEGIPSAAQATPAEEDLCAVNAHPYVVSLLLPDGSPLQASPNGVEAWGSGYRHRFNYPPVPAGIDEATLVISCLFHTRPDRVPEVWKIPLHFVPAPAGMTAFPVIEIPASTAPAAAITPAARMTESTAGLSLSLERAVQMDDGYLLYARLHWETTPFLYVEVVDPAETLHLLDADGQAMLYEVYEDEQTGVMWDRRQTVFAIKTAPVQSSGPLTLELEAVMAGLPVEASFVFDPGPDPQPGQKWQPNVELTFGEQRLFVRSIEVEQTGDGYSFEMSSDTGILKSGLADRQHRVVSGYDGISSEGVFYNGFYYADGLPEGPVTLSVGDIGVKHVQKLQVQWTPPSVSSALLPTQPSACLSSAAWQASLQHPARLPAGLPGKLLTYGPGTNNSNDLWYAAITALDGSQRQVIGEEQGSISPDGTRFAFSSKDAGIKIKDLVSGEIATVPGTTGSYYQPLWTPDGQSIVFSRVGSFDLFLVDPDGADLRQLTFGGYQELPIGWLADGSLLYAVQAAEDEHIVYRLDLQRGESQEFSREDIQAVSPDGRYLAIAQPAFGGRWQVVIRDLDGGNRWSLADAGLSILSPRWSPDGQWILVSVLDTGSGPSLHALINLHTCESIPLPNLQDDVLDWLP